jgi:hypothetical protein
MTGVGTRSGVSGRCGFGNPRSVGASARLARGARISVSTARYRSKRANGPQGLPVLTAPRSALAGQHGGRLPAFDRLSPPADHSTNLDFSRSFHTDVFVMFGLSKWHLTPIGTAPMLGTPKRDADKSSKAVCRVSNVHPSPSPDPKRQGSVPELRPAPLLPASSRAITSV